MRLRLRRTRRGGLGRYLGSDERQLLVTRQHPFVLARRAVDTLGLLLPLAVAAWGIAGIEALQGVVGTWLLRIAFVVMFALLVRLAWSVLEWELERVVVTNEKVIHVAGVLDRRIASTPLAKVSEFTVKQPVLGRVFDYGSLIVDVPGGRHDVLHGLGHLPDPAGLYRLVSDQARRGRVSEGGGKLRVPAPTDADVDRLERGAESLPTMVLEDLPTRPDPWTPTLDGDVGDHTIRIPRVTPPRRSDTPG